MTDSIELPDDTVTLAAGSAMPLLGFGTWQIKGDDAVRATSAALEAGYRHLDTATVYGNEGEVGRALAESGVPRDDVFVTTKCPPSKVGHELDTLQESLDLLQTDHVDLWLIHWPGDGSSNADLWRAFGEAREAGLAREIGVSNFDTALLDEVTEATGVAPAVNQIEWSPLLYDAATVADHRERGIVLEGYSALRGGTLDHPTILEIAEREGRTAAQVIIRWWPPPSSDPTHASRPGAGAPEVMDHSRTPVLEALSDFRRRDDLAFGPPGHRQGRGVDQRVLTILGEGVFASDVLAMNGLDDRRGSQGVLKEAQELMADAVHAEHAFFSTCGSSLSVKSAMLAVAGPGEKLLLSRNAHKSVVSGVVINGTEPVWVHPKFDERRHMAHPPEPDDVRRALREHPDAKGMLLITPTDWGVCADIQGVADVCHEHGVPLIVDEAWGAHLPFHPDLPTWGMNADADVVVTSVHKMGGAIEQSSVFHLQGDRVDPTVLAQREDLLATTSASSLVYASLDGWRRYMVEQGETLLSRALELAARAREEIGAIDGLEVYGEELVEEGLAFEVDPLVLSIDVRGLGITGYQAAEIARSHHHVDLSAADTCRVSARITHADDTDTIDRLLATLRALTHDAAKAERPPTVDFPDAGALELETVMLPRDAFFAEVEQVPADEAVGRIAAEMVTPYPPGVPVLAPGERISREAIDYLRSGVAAGMLIPEAADPEVKTLRVVRDS